MATTNLEKMTATEFNKLFDNVIKQTRDAKTHWMINPMESLIELQIAKERIQEIIKIIVP